MVDTINARLAAVGYPGAPVTTGEYPNPVNSTNFLAKAGPPGQRPGPVQRPLQSVPRQLQQLPGAGGLNTPSASAGLDNTDQAVAFSNTVTLSARTVNETRAQFSYGDLKALPSDPIGRRSASREWPRSGRSRAVRRGASTRCTRSSTISPIRLVRTRCGWAWTSCTTATRSRIRGPIRGAYTFSSLANFLSGVYNNSGFTQTFGTTVDLPDESEPRCLRAGRMEGQPPRDAERRPALRPAVPGNDQHGPEQCLAACGPGVVAVRLAANGGAGQRGTLLRPRAPPRRGERAAVGREHDRPREPAPDQRQPVAHAGRRSDVPEHPERRRVHRRRCST